MTTTTINDIEALGYAVGLARHDEGDPTVPDVYSISGEGFDGLNVSVTQDTGVGFEPHDQELLDALTDVGARTERCFQVEQPDASRAKLSLQGKGYLVERPDPATDVFTITSPPSKSKVAAVDVEGAAPADLIAQDEKLGPIA